MPKTVDEILELIDDATLPSLMSKETALAILELITSGIEARMEALNDEIAEAGE